MRSPTMLILTAVLTVAATPAAFAGTKIMASAPAQTNYPTVGQTLRCNILNLNKSAKTVTIDAVDYSGAVESSSGPVLLNPSTGFEHVNVGPGFAAYCRFTVDGSAKKYRAVAAYHSASGYTIANPAQ